MDNQTASKLQTSGSPMAQLFGANPGYQQPNQVAPITQPQLQTPILPTPEQAAAATRARMLARSPMAAPVAAPKQQKSYVQHGDGSASGRGSGGAW